MAKAKVIKKNVKVSMDQYFRKMKPAIHKYTRAFIEPKFIGIMKTEEEWQDELKQYSMEGE